MQCIAQPTNQQHGWIRSDIDGIHDIYPQVYTQLKSEKHAKMKKSHLVSALLTHSLSALSLTVGGWIERHSLTHSSLTHSLTAHSSRGWRWRWLTLSLCHSLLHCGVRSFVRSFVRSPTTLTHSPHSLPHSLSLTVSARSLTHSLSASTLHSPSLTATHCGFSLTHPPTHSLTPPFSHSPLPHHRLIGCLID